MSESGKLGQIEHSWAALKKETFLYDSFIREDVFVLHKKVSIRAYSLLAKNIYPFLAVGYCISWLLPHDLCYFPSCLQSPKAFLRSRKLSSAY